MVQGSETYPTSLPGFAEGRSRCGAPAARRWGESV